MDGNFTVFDPTTGASVYVNKARLESILGGGAEGGNVVNTNITTAVGGTLTAAAMVNGLISRSGPTAAYSDATAAAADLLATLGGAADTPVGTSWYVDVRNTVPFAETITAGTGVALTPTVPVIPPNSVGTFLVTYSAASPLAFTALLRNVTPLTILPPVSSTALNTVGAATITAAGIAGGLTTRGGAQAGAAFTDTTATAALIIAALPNAVIGQSFRWNYNNTTNAIATITGGVGVNGAGAVGVVPPNTTVSFLMNYTAANTIVATGQGASLPAAANSGTFVANGATPVTVANANVTASSIVLITLKTVGGTVSPNALNVLTITPGTGFTVGGTALDTSTYNYRIIG